MERFSSTYSDLSPMTYSINWPITVRSAVPFPGNYYGPTPVAPRRRCRKNRRAAAAENLGTARRRRHRRYFTGAPPLQ